MTTISYPRPMEAQYNYPRRPPSPPMEPRQCSLPSISNLLGLADAGSPAHETTAVTRQHSPFSEASRRVPSRADFSHFKGSSAHTRDFPPSPPMSTDAMLDSHSPPMYAASHFSNDVSRRGRYPEATPPEEVEAHRNYVVRNSQARTPVTSHPPPPPPPSSSCYAGSSAGSPQTVPGLMYQQPLPQTFPPSTVSMNATPASGAIAWQHHHYLSPAPGHAYTQNQDRYICPTCNKAFSRPSSLRIHSHSHTGEKPFKCSQVGCGKSFSVRSNMKRHERGCHAVEVNTGLSP